MYDSHFYENEKKHEVAIFENKNKRGWPQGKGYMIATACPKQIALSSIVYEQAMDVSIHPRTNGVSIPRRIGSVSPPNNPKITLF